ncbi:glutathione S-transferase [Ephemerocybe angulata]|uniref:glutathione transferase n=1 Tax=Ephemerocybe angulata TaxID=980116 RepID=A0A8H6IKG3_9AGAR|nr:glutathione S-transferase [Tulosesus angulatus]
MADSGIVLHHLENSRSHRILWLLEELGVPYTVKEYKRGPDRHAPKELYEVNPLGKSPVITDGGRTIAESGVIVEYLIARYGKEKFGIKTDETSQEWIDNKFFTHYAEGSVAPNLIQRLLRVEVPKKVPFVVRPLINAVFGKVDASLTAPDLEKHGKYIENQLTKVESKGGWLAGTAGPTSADFMMSVTLQLFLERAPEYAGPKTKEYVKRIQERPAYKKALEGPGGDFAYLYKG